MSSPAAAFAAAAAASSSSAAFAAAAAASSSSAAIDHPETIDWPSPPFIPTLTFADFRAGDLDFPDSDSDPDFPSDLSFDLFDRRPPPPSPDFAMPPDYLSLVGLVSDSSSDSDHDLIPPPAPADPDLCWDCFRIDEDAPDDFEWEEVDGRLDDRALLSMMSAGADSDNAAEQLDAGNVEWEVLLTENNLAMSPFMDEDEYESYYREGDYELDASEYEIMFGQFAEHESVMRGSPAAGKAAVKGLREIVLTEEDVAKNNNVCAVCKDEISLKEAVKQLPCLHHYHGECIVPWLGMRNTCPVCRYELPTDDPEYESWRARRAGGAAVAGSLVRYDVDITR